MPNSIGASGASPNVTITTPSGPMQSAGGASLNVGDKVSARVIQADQNSVTLNIGGKKITADSMLPLATGDLLHLEFGGTNDGLMTLRLLNINRNLAFSSLTSQDVALQLAKLKLPADERTMALVQSMIEFGIPLTQDNVQALLKAAATSNAPADFTMQAANFLNEAKLPLTSQNIQTLAAFFQERPELSNALMQLQTFGTLAMGNSTKMAQLLSLLPGILGEYFLDPKKADKEKDLARIERLVSLARGSDGEDNAAGSLASFIQELKGELSKNSQTSGPFFQALAQLEGLLNGEYLLNSDNNPGTAVYFQIPVYYFGENVTAEVRIQAQPDFHPNPAVLPERFKVEFSVTTPHLGKIQCVLDVLNGNVAAQIFVEKGKEEFAKAHFDQFKSALQKLNCHVVRMEIAGVPYDFWPAKKTDFKTLEKVSVKA